MYKMYGILLGEREGEAHRLLPDVPGIGPKVQLGWYMWCIKGDGITFLIDTGMKDEDVKKRNLRNVRDPAAQLEKINVDPASVRLIIVTHLHSDHFSAHHLYPNATFCIQIKDIEFFMGPASRFRQITKSASDMVEVAKLSREKRIRYLDGDEQILPGIRVVLVGGHTPGSQVVVVNTAKGDVVLCADAIDLYQNLEEGVTGVSGVDVAENLLSWDKIVPLASSRQLIVPGHDPLVMKKFPNPVEGIVEIG